MLLFEILDNSFEHSENVHIQSIYFLNEVRGLACVNIISTINNYHLEGWI